MTTPEQRQALHAAFLAGKARIELALATMYEWDRLTDGAARERMAHQREIFDVLFKAGF